MNLAKSNPIHPIYILIKLAQSTKSISQVENGKKSIWNFWLKGIQYKITTTVALYQQSSKITKYANRTFNSRIKIYLSRSHYLPHSSLQDSDNKWPNDQWTHFIFSFILHELSIFLIHFVRLKDPSRLSNCHITNRTSKLLIWMIQIHGR